MSTAAPTAKRWLFGPVPDLLFGCGVLYAAFFVTQVVAGPAMRTWLPLSLLPFLTLVLGAPHYGATLLRVYETRETRRRYAFFAVYVSLALGAAYVAALNYWILGSALVTLYVTWSPWHYAGQNYGVALMLLRRRGVTITPRTKRLFYLSFFFSYLLTVLALFGSDPSGNYTPVSYQGTVFHVLPIRLPTAIHRVAFLAAALAYAGTLAGAFAGFLRGGRPGDLLPAIVLSVTQALWFVAPTITRHFGWLGGVDPLAPANAAYTFMWVGTGHFVQYLWINVYYSARDAGRIGQARYLGKTLLAGALIWTGPALLFAPGVLGSVPYDLGLGVLTAAVVNLHHFILDGAIWKLRDSRIARVLIRDEGATESDRPLTPSGLLRWRRPAVWAAGAACLVVAFVGYYENSVGLRQAAARNDVDRIRRAIPRLERIGRESPRLHTVLARLERQDGDRAGVRRELERSLALFPTASAWVELGGWHESGGNTAAALRAFEEALALEPGNPQALYHTGLLRLRQGDVPGALAALRRAAEVAPDSRLVQLSLERAETLGAEAAEPSPWPK